MCRFCHDTWGRASVQRRLSPGRVEPGDTVSPDEAIKDPFVLEFLNLKDETRSSSSKRRSSGSLKRSST